MTPAPPLRFAALPARVVPACQLAPGAWAATKPLQASPGGRGGRQTQGRTGQGDRGGGDGKGQTMLSVPAAGERMADMGWHEAEGRQGGGPSTKDINRTLAAGRRLGCDAQGCNGGARARCSFVALALPGGGAVATEAGIAWQNRKLLGTTCDMHYDRTDSSG